MKRTRPFRPVGRNIISEGKTDVLTALGERITPVDSGCWIVDADRDWDRHRTVTMRAARNSNGSPVPAYRLVYETLVGPIPDDHHLHHTCEVKACVNPKHLVPLTPKEHRAEHSRLKRSA